MWDATELPTNVHLNVLQRPSWPLRWLKGRSWWGTGLSTHQAGCADSHHSLHISIYARPPDHFPAALLDLDNAEVAFMSHGQDTCLWGGWYDALATCNAVVVPAKIFILKAAERRQTVW